MQNHGVDAMLHHAITKVGMRQQEAAPYGIGRYYVGDGVSSEGMFWFYSHENLFAIAICDFRALRDCPMHMPTEKYMTIRLNRAGASTGTHLAAYLEEKGGEAHATLQSGTRVAYVEVLYMAGYYAQYLPEMSRGYPKCHLPSLLRVLTSGGQWSAGILWVFRDIIEYEGKGLAAELFFQSAAVKLMALLLQSEQQMQKIDRTDLLGLTTAIDYIADNLANEITQRELARISRMSISKLKGAFKGFTGKTIGGYISAKRIDKAEMLLTNTGMPIEEIAALVGFQTAAGFSTAFRKKTGCAPGVFRQLMSFHCNENPSVEYERCEPPKALADEWA